MKFITEADLRSQYRKEPFTIYEIKPGERLTPGGRQFLMDLGISIGNCHDKGHPPKKTEEEIPVASAGDGEMDADQDWRRASLIAKLRSMDAMFLMTAGELLDTDVLLAQEVMDLGKGIKDLKYDLEGHDLKSFPCKECTGIKKEDFPKTLEDCFEITGFHLQLERGRELLLLHRLRCALREVEPLIDQLFHQDPEKELWIQGVVGKVNQSINTLSQMICAVMGGKKCQKQL